MVEELFSYSTQIFPKAFAKINFSMTCIWSLQMLSSTPRKQWKLVIGKYFIICTYRTVIYFLQRLYAQNHGWSSNNQSSFPTCCPHERQKGKTSGSFCTSHLQPLFPGYEVHSGRELLYFHWNHQDILGYLVMHACVSCVMQSFISFWSQLHQLKNGRSLLKFRKYSVHL